MREARFGPDPEVAKAIRQGEELAKIVIEAIESQTKGLWFWAVA